MSVRKVVVPYAMLKDAVDDKGGFLASRKIHWSVVCGPEVFCGHESKFGVVDIPWARRQPAGERELLDSADDDG
jgi:hypothetical protein